MLDEVFCSGNGFVFIQLCPPSNDVDIPFDEKQQMVDFSLVANLIVDGDNPVKNCGSVHVVPLSFDTAYRPYPPNACIVVPSTVVAYAGYTAPIETVSVSNDVLVVHVTPLSSEYTHIVGLFDVKHMIRLPHVVHVHIAPVMEELSDVCSTQVIPSIDVNARPLVIVAKNTDPL